MQLPSLVSKRTHNAGELLVLHSPKLSKASPADDAFHLAVLLLLLPAQSLLTVFQPRLVLHQQLLHLLLLHQEPLLVLLQPATWHLQALLQLRYLLLILQAEGRRERIRCNGKRKISDHYNLLLMFREARCFFFFMKNKLIEENDKQTTVDNHIGGACGFPLSTKVFPHCSISFCSTVLGLRGLWRGSSALTSNIPS